MFRLYAGKIFIEFDVRICRFTVMNSTTKLWHCQNFWSSFISGCLPFIILLKFPKTVYGGSSSLGKSRINDSLWFFSLFQINGFHLQFLKKYKTIWRITNHYLATMEITTHTINKNSAKGWVTYRFSYAKRHNDAGGWVGGSCLSVAHIHRWTPKWNTSNNKNTHTQVTRQWKLEISSYNIQF